MINFHEYIKLRNTNEMKIAKSMFITDKEMAILGLDKSRGWYDRYKDFVISDEKLVEVVKLVIESKHIKKYIKEPLRKFYVKRSKSEQYLYLMENELGLLKIGISSNPNKRKNSIANASGVSVKIIKVWQTEKDVTLVEKFLHKIFDKHRLVGEWFKASSISAETVANNIPCQFKEINIS